MLLFWPNEKEDFLEYFSMNVPNINHNKITNEYTYIVDQRN